MKVWPRPQLTHRVRYGHAFTKVKKEPRVPSPIRVADARVTKRPSNTRCCNGAMAGGGGALLADLIGRQDSGPVTYVARRGGGRGKVPRQLRMGGVEVVHRPLSEGESPGRS